MLAVGKIVLTCAHLACQGFDFHHAEPGYVMLTQWLPTDEPCMLPPNASHQVGFSCAPGRIDSYLLMGRQGVLYQENAAGRCRLCCLLTQRTEGGYCDAWLLSEYAVTGRD